MKQADLDTLSLISPMWTDMPKPNRFQLKRLMDSLYIEVRTQTVHPWYSSKAEGHWLKTHPLGYRDPEWRAHVQERAVITTVQARLTPQGVDALTAFSR